MKLFSTHEEAYAYWAPIYRTRHERTSPESCTLVKADIYATLKLWQGRAGPGSYTGKLMAELDAVRDRENAIRSRKR